MGNPAILDVARVPETSNRQIVWRLAASIRSVDQPVSSIRW